MFAWLAVLVAIPAAIVTGLVIWAAGALSLSWPGLVITVVVLAILGLIVVAATARHVWPILLALAVLAGSAGLVAGLSSWQGGVGQRVTRPQNRAEIQPSYEFAAGRFVLDLSAVDLGEATVPINVDHHIGRLEVVLPTDAALTSHVEIKGGEAQVLGRVDNGAGVDQRRGGHPDTGGGPRRPAGGHGLRPGGRVPGGQPPRRRRWLPRAGVMGTETRQAKRDRGRSCNTPSTYTSTRSL